MVLVFSESPRGHLKKAAFEAVTFGKKVADSLDSYCAALVLGSNVADAGQLGKYGEAAFSPSPTAVLDRFDSQMFTAAIASVSERLGATVIITSHTSTGKAIAGWFRLGSTPSFRGSMWCSLFQEAHFW